MSISSDLKLISDMTFRLSTDIAKAPQGGVYVSAWFDLHTVFDVMRRINSRLADLEVVLPDDIEVNGTDLSGVDLSRASDVCPPFLVDAYLAFRGEDRPPMPKNHIASLLWGDLA